MVRWSMNGARGTALDFTHAFRQAEAHVERAAALVPVGSSSISSPPRLRRPGLARHRRCGSGARARWEGRLGGLRLGLADEEHLEDALLDRRPIGGKPRLRLRVLRDRKSVV